MYSVIIRQANDTKEIEIHSPFANTCKLSDAKVVKATDAIDSFSFTIDPLNDGYSQLFSLTTMVEVWNVAMNKRLFKGRVLKPMERMDDSGLVTKEIDCEGELAFLHDSYQKYGKWQNMTPKAFFTKLIEVHNAQVESYQQFKVGTVDVTNSTDNVYRYTSDDTSTYDTIQDKLIDRLGGEIQIRYEGNTRYIDYLVQTGEKGNQKIELSKNLLSLSKSIDPTDIITILKPLGNTLDNKDENTDASKPRLTISSVNNGSLYLKDQKLIDEFGIHVGVEVWEDVTQASNLLSKGKEFLNNQKTALVQYQIDAADLSPLDLSVDSFNCGWRYDVWNPLMTIDEELRVVSQTIDINDVTGSTLQIGDKVLSEEQYKVNLLRQIKSNQRLKEEVRAQGNAIGALNVSLSETDKKVDEAKEKVTELENSFNSSSSEFKQTVSDLQKTLDEIGDSIPNQNTIGTLVDGEKDFRTFQQNQTTINTATINKFDEFEKRITQLENKGGS